MQIKTDITGDIDHPVKQTLLLEDVSIQLNDIEISKESIKSQIKLTLEKFNNSQATLSTSEYRSELHGAEDQTQVGKVSISKQVVQSNGKNSQNGVRKCTKFKLRDFKLKFNP